MGEEMKGYITFGELDYDKGLREGTKTNTYLKLHLTITVDGVNRFITRPQHEASASGYIACDALGGELPVENGVFNLFVDEQNAAIKKMLREGRGLKKYWPMKPELLAVANRPGTVGHLETFNRFDFGPTTIVEGDSLFVGRRALSAFRETFNHAGHGSVLTWACAGR